MTFGKKMHAMKKRLEFIPSSYHQLETANQPAVRFEGDGTLELRRREGAVIATLSTGDGELTLRGAKLLGRLDWLYLDFQQHDYLHRIGVFVAGIDHDLIERDMRELTDGTSSGFGHLQRKAKQ